MCARSRDGLGLKPSWEEGEERGTLSASLWATQVVSEPGCPGWRALVSK